MNCTGKILHPIFERYMNLANVLPQRDLTKSEMLKRISRIQTRNCLTFIKDLLRLFMRNKT